MNEDRKQEAISAFEELITQYVDVFAENVELPVLADWCLVVAHDCAVEPSTAAVYRLHRVYQSSYRSAGLLQMAVDDYRGVSVPEDD